MQRPRFEVIFETLSSLLIRYKPGDLMCLDDISSAIIELSLLSPLPELSAQPFEVLVGLCELELRGSPDRLFPTAMSEGLDLLNSLFVQGPSLLREKTAAPQYLVDAINLFVKNRTPGGQAPESKLSIGQPLVSEPMVAATDDGPSAKEGHHQQIMQTFLLDAKERLELAQIRVLDLERLAEPAPTLNELFRVFHTFKGETGFLHLPHLGELAHHFENILDHLRNKRLLLQAETIDLLLEGIDAAKAIVGNLARNPSSEGDGSLVSNLIARISGLLQGTAEPLGSRLVRQGVLNPEQVEHVLMQQKASGYVRKFGEILVEEGLVSPEKVQGILEGQGVPAAPTPPVTADYLTKPEALAERASQPGESVVKVQASQIQYLVDMLGELVISLNQLDDEDRRVQSSRKIAKNLQLAAMQIGTVGIGNLFSTMRRVVRETCRQVGKEVDFLIAGDDLEVDRNLVDKLGEPLMHLLRNAIGHGIESAADRALTKKPPKGSVVLKAERMGHNVVIMVRDDGRGLDQERIRAKAIDKGLIGADKAAMMGRQEIFELIFLPGFSTAEKIDAVSGRGVGMDVVKTMVEQMRGRITLESQAGRFTEVSLTFPINMAIIDGMIVQIGARLFIIPVAVIIESLELDPALFRQVSDNIQVCSLRGETIPVIDLGKWFGLDRPPGEQRNLAVVVEAKGGKYALMVHDIIAKKEVVIKSLGRLFSQTRGIASGTILQGGRIGLVLDIDQIIRTD